jgi:hypothetical protein
LRHLAAADHDGRQNAQMRFRAANTHQHGWENGVDIREIHGQR